jgi:hypothetical protein
MKLLIQDLVTACPGPPCGVTSWLTRDLGEAAETCRSVLPQNTPFGDLWGTHPQNLVRLRQVFCCAAKGAPSQQILNVNAQDRPA